MSGGIKSDVVIERLKALALAGRIRQLDLQFAKLVADLGGSPELVLGAALACFELGRGHVCLPLAMLSAGSLRPFVLDPDQGRDLLADLADPASWPALFAASPLVGCEQEEGETPRWPLRLWRDRLYLTRYHDFELGVARHLRALSERAEWPEIAPALSRLFARDYGLVFDALLKVRLAPDFSTRHFVEKYLDLVFPHEVDWTAVESLLGSAQAANELERLDTLVPEALCCNGQKLAAATAAARPFAVISGGPAPARLPRSPNCSPSWWRPACNRARPRRSGWWPPPARRRRASPRVSVLPCRPWICPPSGVMPSPQRRAHCTGCSG